MRGHVSSLSKCQETAIAFFPNCGSCMVSETLEGGQYRKTDRPMMFSIGNGPLEKS